MQITSEVKVSYDALLCKLYDGWLPTDSELQQLSPNQRATLQVVISRLLSKPRRDDEYLKMFYKKAFKHARKSFFSKNRNKSSHRMINFYKHYFKIVAEKLSLPLTEFYHPELNVKVKVKRGEKSFNRAYVHRLLQSEKFKQSCQQYHQIFLEECKNERLAKIRKLSSQVKEIFTKNQQNFPEEVDQHLRRIRLKAPWTNADIQQAWQRASVDLSSAQFLDPDPQFMSQFDKEVLDDAAWQQMGDRKMLLDRSDDEMQMGQYDMNMNLQSSFDSE